MVSIYWETLEKPKLYSEMLESGKQNLSILQTEISQKQKILTVAKK